MNINPEPLTEADEQNAEALAVLEWLGADAIMQIPTREQSEHVEGISAAAIAYATETQNYEMVVNAWRVYVLARRRTTELCLQEWEGNTDVTLTDIGFTKMQWHRRMQEWKLEMDKVNQYFDDCVAKGWNPSIAGLLKTNYSKPVGGDEITLHRQRLIDIVNWLIDKADVTMEEMRVLRKVIDVFGVQA